MSPLFHMRLVVDKDGLEGATLESPVAIDVVVRGDEMPDVQRVAEFMRRQLDFDMRLNGNWAGIGRGEFVEGPVTLA